jgi:hypothetical protein
MLTKSVLLAATLGVAAIVATPGEARPLHRLPYRHHYVVAYSAPPLVIRKRSYLDPGVAVQPGSETTYVAESTQDYDTNEIFHDRFESNLPRRFEVPGRPEPLFEFETPRDPLP